MMNNLLGPEHDAKAAQRKQSLHGNARLLQSGFQGTGDTMGASTCRQSALRVSTLQCMTQPKSAACSPVRGLFPAIAWLKPHSSMQLTGQGSSPILQGRRTGHRPSPLSMKGWQVADLHVFVLCGEEHPGIRKQARQPEGGMHRANEAGKSTRLGDPVCFADASLRLRPVLYAAC